MWTITCGGRGNFKPGYPTRITPTLRNGYGPYAVSHKGGKLIRNEYP